MSKIIKTVEVESVRTYEREDLLEYVAPEPEPAQTDDERLEEERAQAAEVMAQARAEAERKVREAYAEGLKRGTEAGREQFLEEVNGATRMMQEAAEGIKQVHEEFLNSLEPQVLELVTTLVRKILHHEMSLEQDRVQGAVRGALAEMSDRVRITIRANPQDVKVLRDEKVALTEQYDGIASIAVMEDESVERGGCLVDSETLHMDLTLESQLERVFSALLE